MKRTGSNPVWGKKVQVCMVKRMLTFILFFAILSGGIVTATVTPGFIGIQTEGPAPLTVSFIDQSVGTETITGYEWDFGDGSFSSEKNPAHTYFGNGRYNVTLTIMSSDGQSVTTMKPSYVTVQPSRYPNVKFTGIPLTGTLMQDIYFIDQSELDPAVPDEMYNYFWDFGDGTPLDDSNARNIQHVYEKSGQYLVKLQIQDENGARTNSADPIIITITNQSPPGFHIITATASNNGTIIPSGDVFVPDGSDQSFFITPNTGYSIRDVLVNGKSVGSIPDYTFTDVTSNQKIYADFGPMRKPHRLGFRADENGKNV